MHAEFVEYKAVIMHSELYGHITPKEKIVETISKINIEMALITTSRLMALQIDLMQNNKEAKFLYSILKAGYGAEIIKHNGDIWLYEQREFLSCPQTFFILNKWLLAYGTDPDSDTFIHNITATDVNDIFSLCIMINDYLPIDKDIEGYETEYIYTTIYHNTLKNVKNQIARAFYIFDKLMNEQMLGCKYITDFYEIKGYGIKEYLSVLFNTLKFNNYDISKGSIFAGPYGNAIEFNACELNGVYPLIIRDISSSVKDFRKTALKNINKQWDFELFYTSPLVKFDDMLLNISQITLQYKFFEGLFWTIRFLYKEEDDVKKFFCDFGRPFEKYIQIISNDSALKSNGSYFFQNEFEYDLPGLQHKSPDCFLKKGSQLLVIEAKAKCPHSNTLKGYDIKQIHEEVIDLLVTPIHQVDCRMEEIFSKNITFPNDKTKEYFKGITEIYVICVSMEKIQPVNDLLQFADKFLKSGELRSVLKKGVEPSNCIISNSKIVAYSNFNIEDFEAICNLIENKVDIFPLLQEFFNIRNGDKREIVLLRNYLGARALPYECSSFVQNELQTVLNNIFENTFERK